MAEEVFTIIAGGLRHGHNLKTNGSDLKPGLLAQIDSSGSTISLGDSSNVMGFAFGHRYATYRPTTKTFDDDEPVVLVYGSGEALASVDFFSSGSLPDVNDTLYAAASGLMATSGSVKIGDVLAKPSRTEAVSGVGVSQSLTLFRFNIQP